jgi:2-polyprenyl-6-hydroxyphenyl methylase / 3-demethylubiquinone-9 3-methyltransferase
MIHHESTVNPQELNKFAQHAAHWWDKNGPLKTLHDINNTRLSFVCQHTALKDARVLDVGCGGGIFSEAMAEVGALVTGIDASEEGITAARAHAMKQKIAVDYQAIPIEDYVSEPFDVITCMELLEHVADPKLLLTHCKRLLKPGGMLFVSTINRTLKAYLSAIVIAEYLLGLLPRQTHDYHEFIKPSELACMTRSLDLDLVAMQGLSYNPFSRQAELISNVSVNYIMAFSVP